MAPFGWNEQKLTTFILRVPCEKEGTVQLEKYSQSMLCVAWLLRSFLSELPEPLLTRKFGSSFMKTQSNPDVALRYRNMRKLLNALPSANRAVIRAVLELFRLVLHHRRKNKLSVSEFCGEIGPILLGVEKPIAHGNGNSSPPQQLAQTQTQGAQQQTAASATADALLAAEVLRTLVTQYQYMMGNSDEPTEHESLPLYTKKSNRILLTAQSKARGLLLRQITNTPSNGAHNSNSANNTNSASLRDSNPSNPSYTQPNNSLATSQPVSPPHNGASGNNANPPVSPSSTEPIPIDPALQAASQQQTSPVGNAQAGVAPALRLSEATGAAFSVDQMSQSLPNTSVLAAGSPLMSPTSGGGPPASSSPPPLFAKRVSGMLPSLSASSSWSSIHQREDEEELVSLTDGIMLKFLDQSIRTILFEPTVRISFTYEAKIPNHLKRNYTMDKLTEMHRSGRYLATNLLETTTRAPTSSSASAWKHSLEEESLPPSARRGRKDSLRDDAVVLDGGDGGGLRNRRNTLGSGGGMSREGGGSKNAKSGSGAGDDYAMIGDGDSVSSSGTASSAPKRRSRRISGGVGGQAISFDDLSGESELDYPEQRRRVSSSDLRISSAIDIDGSDSDDSEDSYSADNAASSSAANPRTGSSNSVNNNQHTADAKKDKHSTKKKRADMARRSSTSKVREGSKSKISKEKRRKRADSRDMDGVADFEEDFSPITAETEPPASRTTNNTSPESNASAANTNNNNGATAATAGAAANSQTTQASSTSPTLTADKQKPKAPRPKSKPVQSAVDSKTIMENAPSPPSELPPPLALQSTTTTSGAQ